MNQDEIKELLILEDLVFRMRGYQKEYEKYHASSDRDRKRQLEKKVDEILIKRDKEKKSHQQKMF